CAAVLHSPSNNKIPASGPGRTITSKKQKHEEENNFKNGKPVDRAVVYVPHIDGANSSKE
ncbi:MAG: hypothetical protein LBL42_04820, partial [Tannerella sp.]|nr:hypothetical protein [Tannerella sp.]